MSIFINPKRTKEYVLVSERDLPPEKQHRFKLRCLTAAQYESRKDLSSQISQQNSSNGKILVGTWQVYTLRFGLVGADGNFPLVQFRFDPDTGFVADEFLDTLHPVARRELALAIEQLSTLDAEDLKE